MHSGCIRALAAWPGERSFPQRPAALMGFASLRSVAPQRVRRHLCRPGPTCRSRRAPAPIDFRRGDPARPVGIAKEPEVDEAELGRLAFDFWASLPSAGRARGCHRRGPRSCHGLCLLQGLRAHVRASVRARPRNGSYVSVKAATRSSRRQSAPTFTIRSWASANHDRTAHRRRRRRPFSVLKGRMPCHSGRATRSPGEAPCLRFCTVREKR
jgi:hypothetical protein